MAELHRAGFTSVVRKVWGFTWRVTVWPLLTTSPPVFDSRRLLVFSGRQQNLRLSTTSSVLLGVEADDLWL